MPKINYRQMITDEINYRQKIIMTTKKNRNKMN